MDTTSTLQQNHMHPSNLFKQTTVSFGSDSPIKQMAGILLSKQDYERTETLVGGSKQTHNTQTTLVQNTSAQHTTLLSSNRHTRKYSQEESTISQPSKEATRSQNKNLFFPRSNQQSNKESLFPFTPPPLLLLTPRYPSALQWQDNRRKLTSLLDKQDKRNKELTSSPVPLTVLSKGTPHPSLTETEAQLESL